LCNEGLKVGLSETVEKEVGNDKIVGACQWKSHSIAVMEAQALVNVGSRRFRPLAEELKHGDARIDRIGSKMRVLREQLREKAAVAVAQDQCAATIAELRKKVIAAPFERSTERQVLEPAIRACDEIEVSFAVA
jgi:hypothetical protein